MEHVNIDFLNKQYPDKNFTFVNNVIYYNKKRFARVDFNDYCSLISKKKPPFPVCNYEETLKFTRQMISSFVFFDQLIEKYESTEKANFFLTKMKEINYSKYRPFIDLSYHLKYENDEVFLSPNIIISNNKDAQFRITQYTKFIDVSIFDSFGSRTKSNNYMIFNPNEPELSFKQLHCILYDYFIYDLLKISIEEFSSKHIQLINIINV